MKVVWKSGNMLKRKIEETLKAWKEEEIISPVTIKNHDIHSLICFCRNGYNATKMKTKRI